MAQAIGDVGVSTDLSAFPITVASRDEALPLSFSQQRLWFLAQFEDVSATYNIPAAVRLRGDLDRPAFRRSLDAIIARHEALRSTFVTIDGQPQVELLPADLGFALIEQDLSEVADAQQHLMRLSIEEAQTPFDLAHGPLIRGRLIKLGNHEHVLLLTQHHIVSDGWSIGILIRELGALYRAFVLNQDNPLAPLTVQYPDYAAWQRRWLSGERLQRQTEYWRRALADAPVLLELPTDRPRPALQSYVGAQVPVHIDAELIERLKQFSRQHGVTLFMVILAAWAAVLSHLSGQDDIVIGTPSANRRRHEIEGLIGFFVNTLALRIDLSGNPNVVTLVDRVRSVALAAQDNQDLPFEQVVEITKPPRQLDQSPVFQVMFTWQNNEQVAPDLPGISVESAGFSYEAAKFDLELNLHEQDEAVVGGLIYSQALFDEGTVKRHIDYLLKLLRAMVADDTQIVAHIDLLPSHERELLLKTWNATEVEYPEHLCIHELFEEQVAKAPDATAVVYGERSLSYGELNKEANRLAHHLIGLGVKPDDRVAICVDRSVEMVIGLMAILKAGGAYVPLDPAYPSARLDRMLSDSGAAILLVDASGISALQQISTNNLAAVDLSTSHGWSSNPFSNPNVRSAGLYSSNLMYVIYTSGSTGAPKGVQNEHRALVNRLIWMQNAYQLGEGDRILQKTPFTFDVSVWEFFWPLANGATLVVAPPQAHRDPHQLVDLIIRHDVTTVHFVPSMLRGFVAASDVGQCTSLQRIICSGEALSTDIARECRQVLPEAKLYNLYGPTEAAIDVTAWPCPEVYDGDIIPIGRPIWNTRIYLLDDRRQPVPLGAVGEIYIGGAGVARGYLNRPELTAERFLKDPFSKAVNGRMYKTGDLARYLPDGNIQFLGRNDHQVKIRGFRIELGEIEARLLEHALVREAVVIAREDGEEKRLVAYVVPSEDGVEELAAKVRSHLAACLPEYMVPSAFVTLASLPLTPNGKLDRKALPAPDGDAYARRAYEAPQGEVEEKLAAIWQELLGVERISRHDNFFELGGHSLLAIQLIERLRRIGLYIEIRALFARPILQDLAAAAKSQQEDPVPPNMITPATEIITPAMLPLIDLNQDEIDRIVKQTPGGVGNIQDIYALSPLQEGILFHHLMAGEGDPYLLVNQLSFADRAALDKFLSAARHIVERHDILRTAFIWEGLSTPAQVVWRRAELSVTEVQLDPEAGPISEQLIRRFDPRRYQIDLTKAPLLSVVITYDANEGRWIAILRLHHLIGDHSTLDVLRSEVFSLLDGSG
jgi:amino acid adenylation domain-containing protein